MTVFQSVVVEVLSAIVFAAVFFGGPGLLWLYICWRRDQKRGRKWGR